MADKSPIEWTDATWNPIVGCDGTTKKVNGNTVWTGKLALAPEAILTEPLAWKRPRKIFVNSMGDLFHEDVPDEWIDRVFAVMALAPQHTFQVLTKRAKRMREYLSDPRRPRDIYELVCDLVTIDGAKAVLLAPGIEDRGLMPDWPRIHLDQWPLPNVWLGVSAERQQEADLRIPELLATPAAIRFVSAEPLLGPIDFTAVPAFYADELYPEAGAAFVAKVGKKAAGRLLDGVEHNAMPELHEVPALMTDRERIGQAILNICVGAKAETALLAQVDALATAIGAINHLSGHSLEEAEAVAREAGRQLLDHVRNNWGRIEVAQ